MDNISNGWTNSCGLFLPNSFNIKNNHKIILLFYDIYLLGELLLDTFSEDNKYEKRQNSNLLLDTLIDLPLDDSQNLL